MTTVEARYLAEESIRLLGFVVVLYGPNPFVDVEGERYSPVGEVTRFAYGFKIDFPLRIHREATAAELQRQIEFGVQLGFKAVESERRGVPWLLVKHGT